MFASVGFQNLRNESGCFQMFKSVRSAHKLIFFPPLVLNGKDRPNFFLGL